MHVPHDLSSTASLKITPWVDPVIDGLGHDPRSAYVERFWLGILGPSTTWLLRRIAAEFDRAPDGFDLPLADTARMLGLGTRGGRHSPFVRALGRACQFGLANTVGADGLAVRRHIPPLTRHQVLRLPTATQREHEAWQAGDLRTANGEHARRRARRLALSLVELGEDPEATERQLHGWRFHPALASEATRWAWQRHRDAAAALPTDGAQ